MGEQLVLISPTQTSQASGSLAKSLPSEEVTSAERPIATKEETALLIGTALSDRSLHHRASVKEQANQESIDLLANEAEDTLYEQNLDQILAAYSQAQPQHLPEQGAEEAESLEPLSLEAEVPMSE
jgi:hypothetical protein